MFSSECPVRSLSGLAKLVSTFAVAAFFVISTHPARAQSAAAAGPDVIVFTNGDQLTGKLVSAMNGKVTFHSDALGDITVTWDKIKSLRSSQRFAVIQQGKQVTRKTPASEVPKGTIAVESSQVKIGPAQAAKSLPESQTQYIIDEASYDKEMNGHLGWRNGWTGALTAGASLVEATQNSRTFTGGAALVRTVPGVTWLAARYRDSIDFSAAYGSVTSPGATPTKTNIIHGDLEHDWFMSPRFFTLAVASFDHNYSQGLSLQQIYGLGAGYTVIKNPIQELDFKVDAHYERQSFSATPGVFPVVINPSKNLVGMDVGDTYMRKLLHGMVFNQGLVVTPAFNDANAYSALASAGLLFPVYKRFSFNLGAQDAFLNDPGFGSKKNSFQFTAALGYSLK